MPVVLSYNDVEALGSLALQSGQAQGGARGQQINLQQRQAMQQEATQRMGIEAQERQSRLDRQQQSQQFGAELDYRYDHLAAERQQAAQRYQAGLAEAFGGLAEQQQEFRYDQRLQEQRHQQRMEEIRAREGPGTGGEEGQAFFGGQGVPERETAEGEVRALGHLLPFNAGRAGTPQGAANRRENTMQTAESLAQLPTEQLQQILKSQPDSEYSNFIEALIQRREQASGTGGGAPTGTGPEGRRPGGRGPQGQRQSGARGLGDPRLQGLSDQQLYELAQQPAALQQMMRGR